MPFSVQGIEWVILVLFANWPMVANCSHEKCPQIKKDSVLFKGQVAGVLEISVGTVVECKNTFDLRYQRNHSYSAYLLTWVENTSWIDQFAIKVFNLKSPFFWSHRSRGRCIMYPIGRDLRSVAAEIYHSTAQCCSCYVWWKNCTAGQRKLLSRL